MTSIDCRILSDTYNLNTAALTVTGAVSSTLSVKYTVSKGILTVALPIFTTTATASANLILSALPLGTTPVSDQDEFIHVLDGTNIKIGFATLSTSRTLTVTSTAANGRATTFSNGQACGWESVQILQYALF